MGLFNFDPINFGLGVGAGVLSTIAAQRLMKMAAERATKGERAVVRTYATREADKGYLLSLVENARNTHLMGKKLSLNDILIEPRFIPAPDIVELPEEGEPTEKVFDVVPRIDDYPLLHAVYNIPTLGMAEISRGHKSLVLVGTPGSGRTTALLTIALWSAGYLEFTPPDDEIAQQFEAGRDPKKDLPLTEQAERIRRRIVLAETRASAGRSPEEASKKKNEEDEKVETRIASPFRAIAPMYVTLPDVVLNNPEYGRNIDPAEPFVRALQHQTGYVASRRLVSKTYKVLEAGSALVLIDGYDDLPLDDRPAALRWVKAMMAHYPNNFYIVAMPPEGYGLLMEMGAMPIYLRPWNDQMIGDAADKYQAQWETLYKQPIQFDAEAYRERNEYAVDVKHDARQLSVFDTTMHILSRFKGKEARQSEQMQLYLSEMLPESENILPELQRLGTMQLDSGYITLREMVDEAVALMGIKVKNEPAPIIEEGAADDEVLSEEIKKDPQRRQIANEQGRLLRKLLKSGLLVKHRRGRYQFRHKFIASYLAALSLVEAEPKVLLRKLDNANWDYAMNYLAQLRDVDFLVAEQLSRPLDILHEHILKLSNWLKFAGKEAPWRTDLLRYLGNLLAAPHQFALVRERVAAALISSKDDGALAIFSKVIQTQNPDARRVACLALGVLRAKGAVNAITTVAMQDQIIENKLASVLGLYAIGTDDAIDALIDLMDMTPHDEVRRVIAESFAADRATGYPTLYDMLGSESIAMRRAALFGLGRIDTDWAMIAIDRPISKGDESFVRLAAEVVERKIFDFSRYVLQSYPAPTEVPWLVEWSEMQRDAGNIPYDMPLEQVFDYAVEQEHDGLIRWLAAGTVGQLGEFRLIDKVYLALQDRQEAVRNIAYRSLGEFQQKLGKNLPSPI
jgi:HEAT repeat protein